MQERRRNTDRTAETRTALFAAARELFIEKGYAATGTPEIVARAGVTRGALYHHFADKAGLMAELVRIEAKALAEEIEVAAPSSLSARDALVTGARAYLDGMAVPGRTRLLLREAPAALGAVGADDIDAANARATLRLGLAAALPVERQAMVDELTQLLSAAFERAALLAGEGADRPAYLAALTAIIDSLIAQ